MIYSKTMDRGLIARAAGAALIAALSFGAGAIVGGSNQSQNFVAHLPLIGDGLDASPAETADMAAFWKAWNALSTNFVETHASSSLPSDEEKVWGAISGVAASYGDPYTLFFPPEEAKKFEESISGNFSGIGIEIDTKGGVLTVVAPLKGTPAETAGVLAGDAIVAIDGESTDGIAVEKAVSKIRGTKGTTVALTLVRAEKKFEVRIVRDTIQVPEIEDGLDSASGVYHIALYEFAGTSVGLFNNAFERFKKSGSKLLILDLRGNPGGYLESAVDIGSHFLPKGATVVTEDYQGKQQNEVHQSYGYNDLPRGTKVVVLIDRGSASASEILAGALKDGIGGT